MSLADKYFQAQCTKMGPPPGVSLGPMPQRRRATALRKPRTRVCPMCDGEGLGYNEKKCLTCMGSGEVGGIQKSAVR